MPGVRTVATPGIATGRTLLFPSVPEERWVTARQGTEYRPANAPLSEKVSITAPATIPDKSEKSMEFSGRVDDQGRIVRFDVSTTDDGTARTIMAATLSFK